MMRAPYLKAALIFAVLLALYGAVFLATRKSFAPLPFKMHEQTAADHVPSAFNCQMQVLSQKSFKLTCVPDCRYKPGPVLPYDQSDIVRMLAADQTTPAAWHQVCDKHAP